MIATKCKDLAILDICYCNEVTDDGLMAFEKVREGWNFVELFLSGLTSAGNDGFKSIITAGCDTLSVL